MSAEKRWRKIQGFNHLIKVIEGVKFKDGVEVTARPTIAGAPPDHVIHQI